MTTYSLSSSSAAQSFVNRAAARKRLLHARYLQWANGKPNQGRHTGIVGSSLENALHESLRFSSPTQGFRLNSPDHGKISSLYGRDLRPVGSIDNGCVWYDYDSGSIFQLVMEAKNLRDWIYPWSAELYQLLFKAAYLIPFAQAEGQRVVPVLVCRRAAPTLFLMAKDVGFHIIDTQRQLISFDAIEGSEEFRQIQEVRFELGLLDVLDHRGPFSRITNQFERTLPPRCSEVAARFELIGPSLIGEFAEMRLGWSPQRFRKVRNKIKAQGIAPRSW
jgi:hypothetical protein